MTNVVDSLRELVEICRHKCGPHDEIILPSGRSNHDALVDAVAALNATFALGQRVKVRDAIGRRSKIARIKVNELGTLCYFLADGGLFNAAELEDDELHAKVGAQ